MNLAAYCSCRGRGIHAAISVVCHGMQQFVRCAKGRLVGNRTRRGVKGLVREGANLDCANLDGRKKKCNYRQLNSPK